MDEKLEKVNFLGQYLSSSRSEDQILDMAMIISRDVLGYDHALIRFLQGDELVSRKGIGFPREAADMVIHVGDGVSGEVARTGKTMLVEDTLKEPRFLEGVKGARSELCAPLVYNGRTIGVFNVESERPAFFTERDKTLLETLASQVAAAIETARLREELERAEKLSVVGSMASSILHDIRNDIHSLRVCSDMLKGNNVTPEKMALISGKVRSAGDNIYNLIEDIFEYVKTGASRLDKKKTELKPILESATEHARSIARSDVEIYVEADAGLEAPLDERRIRRMLLNLVNNAVEAMPNGGRLELSARKKQNAIELKISDTGIGIEKERLAKIWEPLYTYGKHQGTGLGMAIVQKIIQDHRWGVSVESEPGKGTCFTILIPG